MAPLADQLEQRACQFLWDKAEKDLGVGNGIYKFKRSG